MENKSLKNKIIMITRPEGQGELLKKAIERRGGTVILFPTLIVKPINKYNLLALCIRKFSTFPLQWEAG